MPEDKDNELINELTKATQKGRIRWTATARPREFTASFLGKFSIIVAEGERYLGGPLDEKILNPLLPSPPYELSRTPEPLPFYELKLLNQSGIMLHRVEDSSIKQLLELARRSALHSDQAIDEILEGLKNR